MNTQGCENLINGIYAEAASDYILGVVSCNKNLEKEAGNFLVSGAYFKTPEEGKYIKKKCLEEIDICKKFIKKFLKSDKENIRIRQNNISVPVLRIIIKVCYQDQLKAILINDKWHLVRKN